MASTTRQAFMLESNTFDGRVLESREGWITDFGGNFIPMEVFFRGLSVVNPSGQLRVSIGNNAPNYDNIMPITSISLTSKGTSIITFPATAAEIPENTPVHLKVTQAASGTSYTFEGFLTGFYR